MGRKVLVSLVSDQTIPNVQLIKEFDKVVEGFIFISTSKMENDGKKQWIIDACKIKPNRIINTVVVNEFSFGDIEKKLNDSISLDDEYIVNITGGTKVMSLVCTDFFNELGAEIYYITGLKNEYIKVFPKKKRQTLTLQSYVNLEEYLISYGFSIKKGNTHLSKEYTQHFFDFFTKNFIEKDFAILDKLRKFRGKNLLIDNSQIEGLPEFLSKINFPSKSKLKLDKYENSYLSGDWFEHYIYQKIKDEFSLDENMIGTGYQLTKNGLKNEFDVLFMCNNKIYVIECKTSIFDIIEGKEKSIIGDVIYKSDSLKSKFGLFANTSIFTLSDVFDNSGQIIDKLKDSYLRAEANKIALISKKDFVDANISFKKALKIT